MTLTDFLLARIDEDEGEAKAASRYKSSHKESLGSDLVTIRPGVDDRYLAIAPDRVLAECEAKRRIVEIAATHADQLRRWSGELLRILEGQQIVYEMVLRTLAMPYADHLDYQQEWAITEPVGL